MSLCSVSSVLNNSCSTDKYSAHRPSVSFAYGDFLHVIGLARVNGFDISAVGDVHHHAGDEVIRRVLRPCAAVYAVVFPGE